MKNQKQMKTIIIYVLISALIIAASLAISGLVAMLLWNWIAVSLFGATPISFWMGVGIAMVLNFISNFFRNAIKKK